MENMITNGDACNTTLSLSPHFMNTWPMPGFDFYANWAFEQCSGWNIEGADYVYFCMSERLFLESTLRADLSVGLIATSFHLRQNPEYFCLFAFTWMSWVFSKTIIAVLWNNYNSSHSRKKQESACSRRGLESEPGLARARTDVLGHSSLAPLNVQVGLFLCCGNSS